MNRRVDRSFAARRPGAFALAAALLALPVALPGCDDPGRAGGGGPRTPSKPAPAPKASWTTDEMAADPEGYLAWADAQLVQQTATRAARIESVVARRRELETRRDSFGTNLDDLKNIDKRLGDALRKAEEEDRLPVRMGGRAFERAKAKAILAEIARLLAERGPLLATYDDGIARLRTIENSLKGDVARLAALRDKLAVDLEQVRVSHGVAELEQLRSTESEIAHYAKILGSLAEESSGSLPAAPPPVDLDSLLEG